ncbi:MAG: hypothetical protein HYX76_02320 [Acidobacteria bacterium]|nr:hypothetical protein [Acidobacteriota bacterium]
MSYTKMAATIASINKIPTAASAVVEKSQSDIVFSPAFPKAQQDAEKTPPQGTQRSPELSLCSLRPQW